MIVYNASLLKILIAIQEGMVEGNECSALTIYNEPMKRQPINRRWVRNRNPDP